MNRSIKNLSALGFVVLVGALTANAIGFGGAHSERRSAGKYPGCEIGRESRAPSVDALSTYGNLPAPIIVGCGHSNDEAVELVAYSMKNAFCYGVYRPVRGSLQGGECKPNNARWTDHCASVCIYSAQPADLGPGRYLLHTVLSGGVSLGAEKLSVSFGDSGKRSDVDVVEAKVSSPSILKRLDQTEPFSVFGAVVPRCVPPGDVRVEAVVTGDISVVRGREALRLPCRAPPLPG